jgi:hypothetical protein
VLEQKLEIPTLKTAELMSQAYLTLPKKLLTLEPATSIDLSSKSKAKLLRLVRKHSLDWAKISKNFREET